MSMRVRVVVGVAIACLLLTVTILLTVTMGGGNTQPPIEGCIDTGSRELYVQHAYQCSDGTYVATFSDDDARDQYIEITSHYGVRIIEQGHRWVRATPLP